ncbi:MAG: ribonuclease J [Chloroflexi bacterium]|nr:ribonuclease J [Ardenticatenaceae bacterium]MBL1130848.1 ribonuclease J [Chloroflexota bacterium]NOG36946.1 ribonuclease J [Chloroflexota bacterium]GIK54529.1 MAG: ribonuclease J [Chloroflexota bacterium]
MHPKVRIIPLGGCGEIGKNMTVIEYDDEIVVVDAGIMFPENDMLGVDAIIPDYSYLKDRLDNILAVLITHGHEDHIGAIAHVMQDIKAPIYATPLTAGLTEVKLRQGGLQNQIEIHTIEAGDKFHLGRHFTIEPFHVAHSIPDCVGFGITTPAGLIVHTGDYKFDHTPSDGWPPDFAKLAEFSARGVLALLADSTNADRPGWTKSEKEIDKAFDELFRNAQGRIIVATFASLISRIQQVANMCVKHGRYLAVTGRSMRDNVKIAQRLGYLEIDEATLIDIEDATSLPPHRVAIMATGSQGEPSAVMGKLARGRHNRLQIQEGDTVVFSAHAIPGNEELVYRTINQLMRRGANVLYEGIANVHVSGHASQEEMKLMINLVRPQYLVPVHGELRHLKQHAVMAQELGIPRENIAIIENGTPLELSQDKLTIMPRLKGGYIFVDGASVGEVDWPVLRDRELLAQGGVFFAFLTLNGNGAMSGEPEILSRGFLDMRDGAEIMDGAKETIDRVIKLHKENGGGKLSTKIEDSLSRYLYSETGRRPLVQVIIK